MKTRVLLKTVIILIIMIYHFHINDFESMVKSLILLIDEIKLPEKEKKEKKEI